MTRWHCQRLHQREHFRAEHMTYFFCFCCTSLLGSAECLCLHTLIQCFPKKDFPKQSITPRVTLSHCTDGTGERRTRRNTESGPQKNDGQKTNLDHSVGKRVMEGAEGLIENQGMKKPKVQHRRATRKNNDSMMLEKTLLGHCGVVYH